MASREFQNVGDLMTDVANGGSARLLAVWALAMQTNRRSRKDLTRVLFAHGIRKKPRWYSVFSNQLLCFWRLLRKMATPHAQSQDVPMPVVKRNYGVDPLHPHHSINCTVVAVLPPFPGHVSLIHAVQTIGARVDALQLRHADLVRRDYALPDMIQRTFVRVPLDIVRQNVLSLRWQPMMLSQLRCGTKLDHLNLLNTIRHVQ